MPQVGNVVFFWYSEIKLTSFLIDVTSQVSCGCKPLSVWQFGIRDRFKWSYCASFTSVLRKICHWSISLLRQSMRVKACKFQSFYGGSHWLSNYFGCDRKKGPFRFHHATMQIPRWLILTRYKPTTHHWTPFYPPFKISWLTLFRVMSNRPPGRESKRSAISGK